MSAWKIQTTTPLNDNLVKYEVIQTLVDETIETILQVYLSSSCAFVRLQVVLQHFHRRRHKEGGGAAHASPPPSEEPLQGFLAGPQQALPAGRSRYDLA